MRKQRRWRPGRVGTLSRPRRVPRAGLVTNRFVLYRSLTDDPHFATTAIHRASSLLLRFVLSAIRTSISPITEHCVLVSVLVCVCVCASMCVCVCVC